MRSVMSHTFSQVPSANIQRSAFNRSHGHKTTFDAGYLIPIYADEALPADTFNMHLTNFGRLATPIAPVMDNIFIDSFFFAVPMRLIWDNWEKFNGAQEDPDDSTDFLTPQIVMPVGGAATGSLSDYLGIPTKVASLSVNSFWHRAYNLIWNTWFRDQNLQDSVVVDKDDGADTYTDYVLLRRGKRHDYFTSCLPWPQKGDNVTLPLGTAAPILGIGKADGSYSQSNVSVRQSDGVTTFQYAQKIANVADGGAADFYIQGQAATNSLPYIRADLTQATASTINELRQAFQVQKMLERDARGGTRYTEIIRSHFGVISPDARMQRPELLATSTQMVNIHPVTQTSSTDATTPQGNLAAFGTTSGHCSFIKSFTEHCVILGLVSARADLNYQQGLNRMFSRRTRYDFYWPALSHIGEQPVYNKEIYAQGTSADTEVFGYQERYAEYRYKPSMVTGLFRSNASGSLDYWHLSQNFGSLPTLNSSFIQEDPPVDRVIAVPSEPYFILDTYFNLRCARPMPVYSVPSLIDHF